MEGVELEKIVAGEMTGQRERVFTALTVYIPGMDEKANGGKGRGGRSCDSEGGLDPCISNCRYSLPLSMRMARRFTSYDQTAHAEAHTCILHRLSARRAARSQNMAR